MLLAEKVKQKNINKQWKGGSSVPGERRYIDISSIQGVSFGGAKIGRRLLMIFPVIVGAIFLRAKSELKERILDLVKELKTDKFLRVDDAGENFTLEKRCKQ
jgi:hypothetical protein